MVNTSMDTRMFSRWINGAREFTLVSKTIRAEGNLQTLWKFEGWNPLPVKGWFESSYPVLHKWLTENGWENISNQKNSFIISTSITETIIR